MSSYIPPHQRAEPGVWGRIIGMRINMFNEELTAQKSSAEWTKAMQERLEKAFSLMPDSYLLSVDCRETTCKVEVIHETDDKALDFNGELETSPVGSAFQDDFVSFVERDEKDMHLKNVVFVERDGPGLRKQLSDLLDSDDEEP